MGRSESLLQTRFGDAPVLTGCGNSLSGNIIDLDAVRQSFRGRKNARWPGDRTTPRPIARVTRFERKGATMRSRRRDQLKKSDAEQMSRVAAEFGRSDTRASERPVATAKTESLQASYWST